MDVVLAEYRLWRNDFLGRWEAGERVPEPSCGDVLDVFASRGLKTGAQTIC
jgi:hypothetical protein